MANGQHYKADIRQWRQGSCDDTVDESLWVTLGEDKPCTTDICGTGLDRQAKRLLVLARRMPDSKASPAKWSIRCRGTASKLLSAIIGNTQETLYYYYVKNAEKEKPLTENSKSSAFYRNCRGWIPRIGIRSHSEGKWDCLKLWPKYQKTPFHPWWIPREIYINLNQPNLTCLHKPPSRINYFQPNRKTPNSVL